MFYPKCHFSYYNVLPLYSEIQICTEKRTKYLYHLCTCSGMLGSLSFFLFFSISLSLSLSFYLALFIDSLSYFSKPFTRTCVKLGVMNHFVKKLSIIRLLFTPTILTNSNERLDYVYNMIRFLFTDIILLYYFF